MQSQSSRHAAHSVSPAAAPAEAQDTELSRYRAAFVDLYRAARAFWEAEASDDPKEKEQAVWRFANLVDAVERHDDLAQETQP